MKEKGTRKDGIRERKTAAAGEITVRVYLT
jgi:hypothetical protein